MAEKKTGAKTIEPVRTTALGSVKPPAVAEPAIDPAESWIETHPEGKDFSAADLAPTPTTAEVPPSTAPVVEPIAAPPSGETPKHAASAESTTTTETPATEPPATEPKATTPATEAPATPTTEVKPATEPAKATVAEPVRVTSEGKYVLAEGHEPWTGEQLVMALRERVQLQPKAKAAEQFEFLFGMPVEEAEKQWKPVLQALWDHRERQGLINDLLFSCTPEKFEYFQRCNTQYDTEIPPTQPARAAQPAEAAVPPALAQELDSLKQWRAEQEKKSAVDQVNREMAEAVAKYPFLAADKNLRDELVLTARWLNAQDPSKTLRDAVAMKASIYDALLVARSAQPTPTPTPALVPALNGSPGASPTATRPANNHKSKAFESLDDAVADWASNDSKNYQ